MVFPRFVPLPKSLASSVAVRSLFMLPSSEVFAPSSAFDEELSLPFPQPASSAVQPMTAAVRSGISLNFSMSFPPIS